MVSSGILILGDNDGIGSLVAPYAAVELGLILGGVPGFLIGKNIAKKRRGWRDIPLRTDYIPDTSNIKIAFKISIPLQSP